MCFFKYVEEAANLIAPDLSHSDKNEISNCFKSGKAKMENILKEFSFKDTNSIKSTLKNLKVPPKDFDKGIWKLLFLCESTIVFISLIEVFIDGHDGSPSESKKWVLYAETNKGDRNRDFVYILKQSLAEGTE